MRSISESPRTSSVHALSRRGRKSIVFESLESRQLLALAAGFESVKITRITTAVATSMEFAPSVGDGVTRLFVVDSDNRQIRLLKNGVLQSTPAMSFNPDEVDRARERGIEAIVFDPNFTSNKHLYLYYTKPDPAKPNAYPSNAVTRLVRYTVNADNDTINKSSAVVLLDNMPNPNGIHNGGAMRFGPDGMLYLAVGEGGISTESQNLDRFGGKVLRLNVANPQQLAPTDNPFYNSADGIGARDYVWAYGFRNPFTGNFKPGTSTFYINDVGGSQWEEINSIQKGRNYGWANAEGNSGNSAYTNPVYTYTHYPNGTSQPRVPAAITGGVFYEGGQFPASYNGNYFFGDQVRKFIKVFDPTTGQATDFHTNDDAILDVLDFDVAPDGALWTLSTGGNIRRIRYVGTANRAPVAAASADKTSGATPLVVNFSGDGTADADGDILTYTWNFGDGTTATGRNVQHTYNADGTFVVKLSVADGHGGSDTSDPITIVAGSAAPTAGISSPLISSSYGGGQTISFAGTGTDPEEGTLDASAFEWRIILHHANHTHPFASFSDVKSGSFVIPEIGENDPDQFYRVQLTVTDSDGVSTTTTRDIAPRTSTLTFASNASGTTFSLDNPPVQFPQTIVAVEGMTRNLGTATTQVVGDKTFEFVSWSDGGAAARQITVPVSNTTYTATFNQTAGPLDIVRRAAADAYVRDGASAGTNFGTDPILIAKLSNSTGNRRESYLRFDLSGISVASNQTVKLRLFGGLNSSNNSNLPFGVYAVSNTTWSETGITWNTKPSAASSALDSETIIDSIDRWYEWDVSNYVRSEKAAGRNLVSFVLKRTAISDALGAFTSDEGSANRPEMVISGITTSPPPSGSTPYSGTPIAIGSNAATIEFELFDMGGEGVAYHDNDATNGGETSFRSGEGVDLKTISGSNYRVNNTFAGEWMNYSVNVQQAGDYDVQFRVGGKGSNGLFHLAIPGSTPVNLFAPAAVPNTGSNNAWTTITRRVNLPAGQYLLRLMLDQNSTYGSIGNFDRMTITPVSTTPPPGGTTTIISNTATYVRAGSSASTNYGNDAALQVKRSSSGSNDREAILKFDLSSASTIGIAKLRLFGGTSASGSLSVGAFAASNTSWTETGVTYNNRPATSGSAIDTTTISGTAEQFYEWDLTSYVQSEEAAGRNTVTIVLKGMTNTDAYAIFNSDDASDGPRLIVTP